MYQIISTNVLTKFHEEIHFPIPCDIITTNVLTKCYEDLTINVTIRMKNTPPNCGHVFQATGIISGLVQDKIITNGLTKFHEDWTINVTYKSFNKIFFYSLIRKNAPPPGCNVFQRMLKHNGQKAITKDHHKHIVLR
ncbi:hypothetical protein DPMN_061922 [Dreissena polymorpha]|uniref:Uncharacterized protein n=1 Tax=Dreissena polymorpha TaxID=45954 RepID=A0A9D4C7W8_DREPO|nr:hypothetical protein DPMN_061922 [Dreissena polymorpha]